MSPNTPSPMNRAARRRQGRRRVLGLTGASLFATTGLLGGYLGNPRLPRAYATPVSCSAFQVLPNGIVDETQLVQAITDVNAGNCDLIDLGATEIELGADLPDITSSVTITGQGQSNTSIYGNGNYSAFRLVPTAAATSHVLSIADLSITHMGSADGGAAAYISPFGGEVVQLYVDSVSFANNTSRRGGAISIEQGVAGPLSVTVTDSIFSGNHTTTNMGDDGQQGGAIFLDRSCALLNPCVASFNGSQFNGNTAYYNGGAIAANDVPVWIGNTSLSTFDDNTTDNGYGGAIYAYYGRVVSWGGEFTRNDADKGGGAIASKYPADGYDIHIENTTFGKSNDPTYGNTALGSSSRGGGAIFLYSYSNRTNNIYVSGSGFYDNESSSAGGAIAVTGGNGGGTNRVRFSTFVSNSADITNTNSHGGAISFTDGNDLEIKNSSFSDNQAHGAGAVYAQPGSNSNAVYGSLFSSNTAADKGGALMMAHSAITNSTFTGNSGLSGSAAALEGSNNTVNFSTITGNGSNSSTGGAIYFTSSTTGNLILNSIVTGNVAGQGTADVDASGSTPSAFDASRSIFTCAWNATDCTPSIFEPDNASALLYSTASLVYPLANNGGNTLTMLPRTNSPVVGVADVSQSVPIPTPMYDQRYGFSRVTNGYANLGALEAVSTLQATFDSNPVAAGSVTVGSSGSATATVTNNGATDSNLVFGTHAIAVGGANAAEFSITSDTCSGSVIGVGQSCAVGVAFAPTGLGAKSATLDFTTFSVGSGTTVALSGSGATPTPTPTPTPNPTPDPDPTPSPSPSPASPLAPVTNATNPLIPATGLSAGSSLFLVDGVSAPVTVAPDAGKKPTTLTISAPGLNMSLQGRKDGSDPTSLTSGQALVLQSRQLVKDRAKISGPSAYSTGDGFKPNSEVRFYFLNDTLLGTLTTDANGAYSGSVPIPDGVTPGVYTLQVNGFSPTGAVRSLSLGVLVKAPGTPATTKHVRSVVKFHARSAELTTSAKAHLRRIAKRVGDHKAQVIIVGLVQADGNTWNDKTLSRKRAHAVAAYLRARGVRGDYTVRGGGQAPQPGKAARRADIAINWTP